MTRGLNFQKVLGNNADFIGTTSPEELCAYGGQLIEEFPLKKLKQGDGLDWSLLREEAYFLGNVSHYYYWVAFYSLRSLQQEMLNRVYSIGHESDYSSSINFDLRYLESSLRDFRLNLGAIYFCMQEYQMQNGDLLDSDGTTLSTDTPTEDAVTPVPEEIAPPPEDVPPPPEEIPVVLVEGWPAKILADVDLQPCPVADWGASFESLNPRERRIITQYYAKNRSLEKIAEEEGEIKTVRALIRTTLKKIKVQLSNNS